MSVDGCVSDLVVPQAVTVYPLPLARFHADPERTSILNPVISFVDESARAAFWEWDLGDESGNFLSQSFTFYFQSTLHTL